LGFFLQPMAMAILGVLHERVEQLLRLDEVGRVEALGEPAVDRGKKIKRLPSLAPLGQEPRERDRGLQLPAPRTLAQ
jgi:hypothetical protein